jgi:hypothetical protein
MPCCQEFLSMGAQSSNKCLFTRLMVGAEMTASIILRWTRLLYVMGRQGACIVSWRSHKVLHHFKRKVGQKPQE